MKKFFMTLALALATIGVSAKGAKIPVYAWSGWGENTTEKSLTADFKAWKKHGVTGVCINAGMDGNQQGIEAAKKLLAAKGASYRNIYFASGSDAGKFALNIMAFPTTYVFDRDGNVVGQPLLGGIDKEENLAALQKNIDAALAKDSAK